MDPDPFLVFLDMTVLPRDIVESLPFTYVNRLVDVDVEHFFNHPEFIYREEYMNLATTEYYHSLHGTRLHRVSKSIVELLKRKRDRQYAVITMSALADRYRTDVYVQLTLLVESFL